MATILREGDLSLLRGKVAIIGYGAQGHAHALNLRDSGVQVHVGLRESSLSRGKAEEAGLTVGTAAEATKGAQLVAMLVPDQVAPTVFADEVEPNLEPGAVVLFAHGFNVLYGRIAPSAGHDVVMVGNAGSERVACSVIAPLTVVLTPRVSVAAVRTAPVTVASS